MKPTVLIILGSIIQVLQQHIYWNKVVHVLFIFVMNILTAFHTPFGHCDLNNLYICFVCFYQAYLSDEKSMAKTQTIVLRHLYLLLGYNQNERGFYSPPQRLRYDHGTPYSTTEPV